MYTCFLQTSCKDCPTGYFCDGTVQNDTICLHGVQNPESCPPGYYCPLNTKFETEFPCPNGTYNPNYNSEDSSACVTCTAGSYCGSEGLPAPTGLCNHGYYCELGASVPNPTDAVTGNICPAGTYCNPGSIEPTDCPTGTYSPTAGTQQ